MLPWFENGAFPLYLAPMARYTDVVFRGLCKAQGADVMVTEFVMAGSLVRGGERAWETVDFTEEQRPMGVQIFGSEPEEMGAAARLIEERMRPDFIDMNFGCPADRVTCADAGSSLLRDLPRMGRIAKSVAGAVESTPVTGKIRIGWDDASIVAVDAAKTLEDAGIQAVAVHGRTKEQGYRGDADWTVIDAVARAVGVPVVGNGSVRTAADVVRVRSETACRGVMIGRAALGYPWIFREIKHIMRTGESPPMPTVEDRWEAALSYCRTMLARPAQQGRQHDLGWMRARLKAFTKAMPGGSRIRCELDTVRCLADLEALAARHLAEQPAA